MKHSQTIGIAASVALIAICFLPWSFIESQQITVTGFHAEGTNYGKPGLFNIIMSVINIAMFLIPAIWSKRTNVFIASFNLAWSVRNYLLLSSCMMGECPEKKPALFILVGLSVIILVMTLLPKIEVGKK